MSWVLFTLGAVFLQTGRNALQSKLSDKVDTLGVTLSRFLFALPIALAYLLLLSYLSQPSFDSHANVQPAWLELPQFSLSFVLVVVLAALLQIAATSFMVMLFKQRNFAIGAGLAKSEALVAGILGTLFFGSYLSVIGWLGIILGGVAVFVLSAGKSVQQGATRSLSTKTLCIGLASGACFALTSLFVREASHLLALPLKQAAAWVLLWVVSIQAAGLSLYIFIRKPNILKQMLANVHTVLVISTISCLGSVCWFTAMALQHVAYVKTLGQIEVLLTLLLAHFWLNDKVSKREIIGLLLIGVAATMVMWA